MPSTSAATDAPKTPVELQRQQRLLGGVVAFLGVLALLVPLAPDLAPEERIAALLLATAAIELFHGFRRADPAARRSAWFGGGGTLALGGLLAVAPALIAGTVVVLAAVWFGIDALRFAAAAYRDRRAGQNPGSNALAALSNGAVVFLLALPGGSGVLWTLAIAAALRIFSAAGDILRARILTDTDAGDHVVQDLGLADLPELRALGDHIEVEEETRRPIDRHWVGTFILTLFAIHLGRMGLDRTTLGIISPGVAVLGDLMVAVAIGLLVVVPVNVLSRPLLRPLERLAWRWCLREPALQRWRRCLPFLTRHALMWRLRQAIRLRQAVYSLRATLACGLRNGLPIAAILTATTPFWGVSWYFDTENYAAGIWNAWAEARTDDWRIAMVHAVQTEARTAQRPPPDFTVTPSGLPLDGDFSFLIIGDTGEGDASQHVLRDQLILAAAQPDVRFVVISSDVVYPEGEMKHYEARFWLPFKGVTKPVYAIPGNHDWYDALEGFAATFLDPAAARTVMRARVEADLKISRSTDSHIESLLREAARLRSEYRVPTGFQQAPFFQLQTATFALFAVDTGVQKRLDEAQLAWFRSALEAARGKFKFVLLGHPLYACGQYRATDRPEFAALHQLLREHDVRVVMAGDTHDLEYYVERETAANGGTDRHHFVNGGGGAFLTYGVQLADPQTMPSAQWAFYPPTAAVRAKVEANNPFWKVPLWWWTHRWRAWPSAPEWLSAAFDYNVAPFFQSFCEIRVEPSQGRVRILPWGIHGRLRWADLQTSPGLRPAGVTSETPVEWSLDLTLPARAAGAPPPPAPR